MSNKVSTRNLAIDVLRLFAAFLVVCIHCPFENENKLLLYFTPPPPLQRVAVPIFFIISGYFLFTDDKQKTEQRIKISISKITRIYLYAFFLYLGIAIIDCHSTGNYQPLNIGPWKLFVWIASCSNLNFPYGFHLWFLIALIESLCCMLVLNKFSISSKMLFYGAVILFIMGTARVYLTKITGYNPYIPFAPLLFGSLPYLCMGYVMNQVGVQKRLAIWLLVIGILCNFLELIFMGHTLQVYFGTFLISIGMVAICMNVTTDNFLVKQLAFLGKRYSLWIYILHVLVMSVLKQAFPTINYGPIEIFLYSLIFSVLIREMIIFCKMSFLK